MTTKLASATELQGGLYVKMAVGSNVETESNSSVRPQSEFHSKDGENCFGLPYQDHNYGASPLTLSSHSAFIPRQINGESCFSKIVSNSSNMCVTPNASIKSRFVEPNLHRQNGLLRADDLPLQKMLFPGNNISLDSNATVGDVTRCICGFKHDDGYMISCDHCAVWQHIDCVNIDRNNIPDTYLCDICNPRPLKKEEAIRLQAKRMKELSTICDLNSSEIDSGDEKEHRNVTYTAVQSTPTSLTITSNRNYSKKRKRSKDDNKRAGKKAHMQDRKRSRSTSKSSCADSLDDDHVGTFTWSKNLKEWAESYHPIDENLYTAELLQAVLSSHKSNESIQQKAPSVISQLHKQLIKVQQLRDRVIALEDIPIFSPVVEVLGSYMLSKQAETANSGVYKRPYPYVFFYNGFDGLDIVVDSRGSGNISRYARRSCCPNCEVRHITEDNKIYLFIYSKENIEKGSEITIPFDFKYQNCLYNVECGCGHFKDCPVYKFTNMRMEREQDNATKQSKNRDDEFGKVSPLRLPLSRIHEHTNGYASTDPEGSNLGGGHIEGQQQENQRKKSREDRKMEAYIRAFERMEKQKKKKEQLHHTNSYEGKNHVITSVNNNTATHTSQTTTTTQSVTTASEEASTTPVTTVTPQRRANRRRSTKSGRKNSRRGRGASFEGAMSPTSFIDNASSHSLESSNLPDSTNLNSDSLQWLPPLTIEPSMDSNLSIDMPLSNDQPDVSVSSYLPNSDPCVETTDLSVFDEKPEQVNPQMDESVANQDISAMLPLDADETNKVEPPFDEVNRNLETAAAESDHKSPESSLSETQHLSTGHVKSGKKKSASSSENLPATVNKSDATNNPRDFTNCSFEHWDYRPGVPNGQVHIGVRPRKGRKYLKSVYIKKNWLDMAKHEDLIPESCSSAQEPVIGFKKRLLHTFSKDNTFSPTAGSETSTKPELFAGSNANLSTEAEPTSPASAEAVSQTQQTDSSQLTVNTDLANVTGNEPGSTTVSLGIADQPLAAEGAELPSAIQYENISDDEASSVRSDSSMETLIEEISKGLPQQEILSAIIPRMNGEINPYGCPLPAFQTACKPGDDNAFKPVVSASTTEDSKNAPTKKKVSLQEYWKRSKGSRKSSVEQTNSSANTKVTSNSSTHLRTPPSSSTLTTSAGSPTSHVRSKDEATAIAKSTAELDDLSNDGLTEVAKTTLKPEILHLFERTKKNRTISTDSSKTDSGEVATKPGHIHSCRTSASEIDVSKPSISAENLNSSTAFRPHVERSFSSPNIRQNFQSQSDTNLTPPLSGKKSAASLQNSPAHQTAPNATGSTPKGFASPVSASPWSSRGQSASFSSQSPTPYKHRKRSEHNSTEGPSIERVRSRHGSSTSSGGNSTPSNKSPKQPTMEGGSSHSSSGNQCLTQDKPNGPRPQDPPQKVQSLTPAVPGQPIPSLMRGPGSSRIPQVVYNRRPSPRMDGGSPHWESQTLHETSVRSLKDIPYTKQEAYHQPKRPRSPLSHMDYDRVKKTAEQHYYERDRYLYRPLRREEDHIPIGTNPPNPYYHPLPYYSQGYRSDRPSYPPSRGSRPPSPGPPPRHNPEYYSKTNNHRPPSYYPQDIHRR